MKDFTLQVNFCREDDSLLGGTGQKCVHGYTEQVKLTRRRRKRSERERYDVSTDRPVAWFPSCCEANLFESFPKKKRKCKLGVFPSSGWNGKTTPTVSGDDDIGNIP